MQRGRAPRSSSPKKSSDRSQSEQKAKARPLQIYD